jgi:ubiquinone/menaquinone biosynthesis C-methylase UbiE
MSLSTKLIKLGNKIFPEVKHPFNMQNDGEMTYAEWQYMKGEDTVACYKGKYYPEDMFPDKTVLDMGCGAAGKSLWYASLGAKRVIGCDIVERYEEEAMSYARRLGLDNVFNFICCSATELPFPSNTFDTIIMNDFMEHVSEPEEALLEAMRLLKPDGKLFINFPPWGHPFGAHMSDVIYTPWVHKLFSEKALIAAYKELCEGLPDAAERISLRIHTDERGREYLGYVNRMTLSRFKRILKDYEITPLWYAELPLRPQLKPLARFPLTKELFVRMAVCVLGKKEFRKD